MYYTLLTSPTLPVVVLASLLLIEFFMWYRGRHRPALATAGVGKSRQV